MEMSYHPSYLSTQAREKIIQAQTPVPPIDLEQKLIYLCETIRNMERWQTACQLDGRTEAAQVTAEALARKRALLQKLLKRITENEQAIRGDGQPAQSDGGVELATQALYQTEGLS